MEAARYIHGTSSQEQTRLDWLNRLLNERELAEMALEGGERALELGAGTGVFARALAARLPRGYVLAIELDERQLAKARLGPSADRLELRCGDVLAPPLAPAEWGSFDLVHARFLLEHLARPAAAVTVMARAVRAGGRVVLVDDDHATLRLWPEVPSFEVLWRAYCELYTRRGMDPWIGRRLPELALDAGLEPRRASALFFGGCRGTETFPVALDNLRHVVAGASQGLLAAGLATERGLQEGLAALEAWARGRAAALWYAVPYLEAVRPAAG